MNTEIEALRKILASRQQQMAARPFSMESYTELLDQEFWARFLTENKKKFCARENTGVRAAKKRARIPSKKMLRRGELKTVTEDLDADMSVASGWAHRRRAAPRDWPG